MPSDYQEKLQQPAQFVRQNRSSWFLSRTSFFSSFLNLDAPITKEYYEIIENILFQFFHNGLEYKEIILIEIFLRASIKTEYTFLQQLTPVDFTNYYNTAVELEQKKLDDAEKHKREGYVK